MTEALPPVDHDGAARAKASTGWVASVLALPIHLVTLVLVVLGVWIVVSNRFHLGALILGGFVLLIAWELRPRLGTLPKDVVPRSRAPALYELIDRVSAHLGTRPIAGLRIVPDFAAATERVGLRRRSLVILGLPLISILEPQERVALVAHEVAHLANGDPRRGTATSGALDTLETWSAFLQAFGAGPLLVEFVWTILRSIPWVIVRAYRWALLRVVVRESRRAEFFADRLAAEVAGSGSTSSMLRKLALEEEYHGAGMGSALDGDPSTFFERFRRRAMTIVAAGALPEPSPEAAVDDTHPPTVVRIALVEATPRQAALILGGNASDAIDADLRSFEVALATHVIDVYRDRLYH